MKTIVLTFDDACRSHLEIVVPILEKYGFGATLITKSTLALRDIDLFEAIHKKSKFVLQVTLTTAEDSDNLA